MEIGNELIGLQTRMRKLVSIPPEFSDVEPYDVRERFEEEWARLAEHIAKSKANAIPIEEIGKRPPWPRIETQLAEEAKALQELRDEANDASELAEEAEGLHRKRAFVEAAKGTSRGSEAAYFGPENDWIIEIADEEELLLNIGLIEVWIEECREAFIKRWIPWLGFHFATDEEYRKHFPKQGWDTETIRAKSSPPQAGEPISYFYPGVTRDALMEHFWYFLAKYWDLIKSQHHHRLYEDAIGIIGASMGENTDIILWDIHASNAVVHAFPVRRADVPVDKEVLRSGEKLVRL